MDVLILVGDPTCQHRVGIAKECASILRGKSIQAEISATAGDCETFSQEKITSRIIIAVASPGSPFPAVLACAVTQPVILLATSEDKAHAGSPSLFGSSKGPLARVALNCAPEAAALAAKLLASFSVAASPPRSPADTAAAQEAQQGLLAASARAAAVEQSSCNASLSLGLGLIGVVESVERRTQAYLPVIEAERKSMGLLSRGASRGVLGTKAVPDEVLPGATRYVGKVRDVYLLDQTAENSVVMVATGRQSAFDRHLASVPFKGQVLNLISLWWFEQTSHLVPNHVLYCPHPSAVVGKRCAIFPIEFVVRGYMTGTTSTSMWTHYKAGERSYCGHALPDGMVKNQKIGWTDALVTPSTKSDEHDEPIAAADIVSQGIMTQADWDTCEGYAKALFGFGSEVAKSRGLILCDTKYEFGRASDGAIVLCDEVHTPDSSRYWLKEGYEERFSAGLEPHNVDKEFLRRWFVERCDPYKDDELPAVPPELICELSRRYLLLYELITGSRFTFPSPEEAATAAAGLADPDEKLFDALRKARAAGKLGAPRNPAS